jgi:hypothetical protein
MGGKKKNAWQNSWEQKNAWDTTALVRRFYYSDTIYSCPNTITITLLLSRYFCSLSACVDKIPEMRKKVKTKKRLALRPLFGAIRTCGICRPWIFPSLQFSYLAYPTKSVTAEGKKSRQPVAAVELSPTETCPGRPVRDRISESNLSPPATPVSGSQNLDS